LKEITMSPIVWKKSMSKRSPGRSHFRAEEGEISVIVSGDIGDYTPRTPLGLRLFGIRSRIVQSGAPLLVWSDLEREIKSRRGA
jgi:hypothetical protein